MLLKTKKMSNFPLYDNLERNLPKKDLTVKQKEKIIKKIEDIDNKGRDLIVALIQFYYIKNEHKELNEDLPYKGIRTKIKKDIEDITWSFTDFPIKLRHILYKFVLIHMQSIKEEQARQKHII